MGAFLEPYFDLTVGDGDLGGGIDQIAKEVATLGLLVAVADAVAEESIETAGQQGQLQVTIDLHGHRRGERVHVEEVDAVGDVVLDHHALGIAADQLAGRAFGLVGQQQGGFFVAQFGDDQLADRAGLSAADAAVQLMELVLTGRAMEWPGNRYSRA